VVEFPTTMAGPQSPRSPRTGSEATREQQARKLRGWMLGLHATHLIDIGGRLGYLDALRRAGGPVPAEALARATELDPWQTEVWCQAACTIGILDYRPGEGFGFAPHIGELLAAESPELATFHMLASIARDFPSYPRAFRTGARKPFSDHDEDFFFHQTRVAAHRGPVVVDAALAIPELARRLDAGGALLDVGAGGGGVLLAFAERLPTLRAVGIEPLPYFATRAANAIAEAGLDDRVTVRAIPAEQIDFEAEFDLVTLVQVFHELPPESKREILRRCRRALRDGGHLLIIDRCVPGDESEIGDRRFTMSVLEQWFEVTWGNVVNTRNEIAGMLEECGFSLASEDEKSVPTYWIFVARPA
jgi:SAM-dependent methyltransferase